MCWGFDHRDGWFEIIWQLSLAIEEELGYSWAQERWFLLKKKFARRWNMVIYKLSPVRHDKQKLIGTGTKEDPKHWVVTEKAKPTWDERLVQKFFGPTQKIGRFNMRRLGLKRLVQFPNTGFHVDQVKEKFGTLRFYCGGDDRIGHYVSIAQRLSAVTCEECGKNGKLGRVGGWYSTRCVTCAPSGWEEVTA